MGRDGEGGAARRRFLKASASLALAGFCGAPRAAGADAAYPAVLEAAAAEQQLAPAQYPATAIWGYNDTTPGPLLRVKQGGRLRITLANGLARQDTTVHWHGIRLPNAMDGVPHLTQPPVRPGERFAYEFDVPDAGTYWYHPHVASYEQVARGLHGALVVEEERPIEVDRDLVWVLADWRMTRRAAIQEDFNDLHDLAHAGRLGSVVTINGRYAREYPLEARAGERVRLRLVNAAVARIFGLRFAAHRPVVVALDGQPVAPHALDERGLVLAPGMRADLVIDFDGKPGGRHVIEDTYYPGDRATLTEIAYADGAHARAGARGAVPPLPANPLAEPDPAKAERHVLALQGGAMGALREARVRGAVLPIQRMLREHHLAWAINGVAGKSHEDAPLLELRRGRHYVLALRNETGWDHPIHLHGHVFRVLARDGTPVPHRPWRDTVLVSRRETVEIALVADNPGDWMLHCHALLHQEGGMMGVIRVG
ncbi:MAG: multicopper oxidase family protein [Burkholderiales bacterium]|nr:multicopper oxidase family protein [Burkholderiales bacterium]